VQQVAKEQGYRLVLLSTEALASEEFGIIRSLSKQYVDGLIISPLLYSDKHRELIKQAKRPVVVITGTESDPDIDSVLVDSSQGVRLAMEHLLAQGRSRIAFLNGRPDTVPGVARLNGYYTSVIEHGLPRDDSLVFASDFTLAGGYQVAGQILEDSRPDAIMCANDLMALGVMRYLREQGLRVPEDVAVVGMDDIEHAATSFPSLTTVSLLAAERGRMAAELLLNRLTSEEGQKPRQLQVVPRLIVRESSVVVQG
jgi:LacI family transcriptional regulator